MRNFREERGRPGDLLDRGVCRLILDDTQYVLVHNNKILCVSADEFLGSLHAGSMHRRARVRLNAQ